MTGQFKTTLLVAWAAAVVGCVGEGTTGATHEKTRDPPTAAPTAVERHFRFGDTGWLPATGRVVTGGLVHWHANPVVRGDSVTALHYWYSLNGSRVFQTLDFSSGYATSRFHAPVTVHFCANSCWDPPDFGMVHVE